ncbi:fibronectin type III domain-containing protein, partial [Intestinibacter sp.]|uniref:fibronectin type III domain-containing protein n=1 Tax=Intestinibacter sp. TaxID=1965304 RepID=UPI003F16703B
LYIYGYKGSTAERYSKGFAEDEGGNLIKFMELKEDSNAPDKVNNFREASKTNSQITLSWDEVKDCSGYEIYRYSSSSKKYVLIDIIANSETTSYTDKDRLSATTYSYKIRAFKASTAGTVYSEDSDILKVTTKPLKPVFSSSSTTTSTVTLNWKNVARASGYEIYRYSTTNSSYNLIGEVSAGTTTYKDTGRVSANIYTYKVRAYKVVNGKKIYSNYSDSLKVVTKPLTPKVTLSSTVSRSIKVSWTNCSTKATGYEVYMATSKSGTYKLIKTTTSKSYTKTGLTKGKTYYFKVRAYRTVSGEKIYGNYSTVKYIKCR